MPSGFRMVVRHALCVLVGVFICSPVAAQQRPLVTEDPEPIGAGRVLIEGGVGYSQDEKYTVSGLEGNLWRIPTLGVSVGISSIAELQFTAPSSTIFRLRDANRRRCPTS